MLAQDLTGALPSVTEDSASKIVELRMSNTSLHQCDASQLAVWKEGLAGTTLRAGKTRDIGTDIVTGCLPEFLLFCDEDHVDDDPLYCPSVSFRRPVQAPVSQVDKVCFQYG